ncbi:DUF1302 domain-containing protein [Oceaniserpentilla sp. 4NH20-0058]|uniref:DUF1302 domain-containing protein n=1 Tax=Oceaniserpentilla sp. 4NH20-0058 TaxID=3127660 RepID=UPI0031059B38
MKINPNVLARKKLLALAVPMLMFGQAQAVEFEFGEASLTVDSQLSIGSSWRMEEQNKNLLNYTAPNTEVIDGNTSDDGNRNYEKGDAFSQIFKGSHDLQFTYQNYGAFVRAKYWYDSAIENNSVEHGHSPTYTLGGGTGTTVTFPGKSKIDDSDFNDLAKGKGATILDAFVYGSFDIGEMPLDVRLGKQVVSWGESTFIQGGINSINPVDAAAFRRPGAEIKEGLLPVSMIYANLGLTDSLSVEAFYQLEWQETVGDGCGTYFSTSDVSSEGCNTLTFSGGAISLQRLEDGDRGASDDGQFGLSLRYFSDELDTEFGFYAMNIHSRLPIYSVLGGSTGSAFPAAFGGSTVDAVLTGGYFMEYPEDIKLVGVSFAGNAYGVALSGEVSHKMDAPVQVNGTFVTTMLATAGGPYSAESVAASTEFWGGLDNHLGEEVSGYRTFDITQAQVTAIHLQNQVLGASAVALIVEAGMNFVHDFDDVLRYGKSSIYQAPSFDGDSDFDGGFMTETSWGYRAVASAKYTNAFMGVDLNPVISFSHDVDGYAPSPGGQFQEDVKKLGLTLKANYLQRYDASISYNMFMGGDFNDVKDRDFLAISAGVQF